MRILYAGGGTAGHINPALSIAAYAKKHDSEAAALFIGKRGNMEESLVPRAGFDIEFIDIEGFKRKLTPANLRVIFKTVKAIGDCKKIMRRFRPDVVITTGGYVSGPVMCAAHALHIPAIIHEQNVFPGMTVKMSAKYADVIATSFADTQKHIKQAEKCIYTGNPVREDILTTDRKAARAALGLDERPFILAFGGSLGADRINDAMIGYLKMRQKDSAQLLFGTGKRNYDAVMQRLKAEGVDVGQDSGIAITPYIDNMNEAMAAADLIISRAGAISISEITALGKPSILIPSPNVAHNHQETNARLLEQRDAALVITDAELTAQRLADKVDILLDNPTLLYNMGKNARQIGVTNASQKIYELACKLYQTQGQ